MLSLALPSVGVKDGIAVSPVASANPTADPPDILKVTPIVGTAPIPLAPMPPAPSPIAVTGVREAKVNVPPALPAA